MSLQFDNKGEPNRIPFLALTAHLLISTTIAPIQHLPIYSCPYLPHPCLYTSTMRVQNMISGAFSLASLSISQAAALPAAGKEPVNLVAREIPAVESFLCITVGTKKCGLYVSYTNGVKTENVQTESGGLGGCTVDLYRRHTNRDGFWANVNIAHKAGLNIGYSPTGRTLSLGAATATVNNPGALSLACQNIFGFTSIDQSQSGWNYWAGFNPQLY